MAGQLAGPTGADDHRRRARWWPAEALPPRRSSMICWRRSTGRCGSVSASRSSSDALEGPGEAEQLVLDLVERRPRPGRRRTWPRRRRRPGRLRPSARPSVASGSDLVDVAARRGRVWVSRVEAVLDDRSAAPMASVATSLAEVGDGLGLGRLDVGRGPLAHARRCSASACACRSLLHRVGLLAGLLDDAGRPRLGVGQLGLVLVEHTLGLGLGRARRPRGRCGSARCGPPCPS